MKRLAVAVLIAAAFALAFAARLSLAEPCHTDTECGCTDDCLEPAQE